LTREAYALDLRQFIAWCQEHHLRLFAVRRADIEIWRRRSAAVSEPRLWIEHAYLDVEDVDDFDLPALARVSPPGWSDDRPDTAMVDLLRLPSWR
jgi:hypothetical protein